MANSATPPMSDEFSRWYRAVDMGQSENQDTVKLRWAGVDAFVHTVTKADTEALVRLAFKSKQKPDGASVAKFQACLHTADTNYPTTGGNERELEVLAGAALAALFREKEFDLTATAALQVTVASFGKNRIPNLPVDLVAEAENTLPQISQYDRSRPDLGQYFSGKKITVDFGEIAKTAQPTPESLLQSFTQAGATTGAAIKHIARGMHAVEKFFRVQDEELQMLWWLTGQRSREMNCTFDSIPINARPLILSYELAALTGYLPGPTSIIAILSRSGIHDGKKLVVSEAINGADPRWLEKVVNGLEPSPITQPIHFGIKRKLETNDNQAWITNWSAVTGLKPDISLTALELALLFYRESLLARD